MAIPAPSIGTATEVRNSPKYMNMYADIMRRENVIHIFQILMCAKKENRRITELYSLFIPTLLRADVGLQDAMNNCTQTQDPWRKTRVF